MKVALQMIEVIVVVQLIQKVLTNIMKELNVKINV